MAAACVFGDWTFSWMDTPWYAYRQGSGIPLKWTPDGPRPSQVKLSDTVGTDVDWMALAAHWAREHREMFEAILGGPVELDGFPRGSVLP